MNWGGARPAAGAPGRRGWERWRGSPLPPLWIVVAVVGPVTLGRSDPSVPRVAAAVVWKPPDCFPTRGWGLPGLAAGSC